MQSAGINFHLLRQTTLNYSGKNKLANIFWDHIIPEIIVFMNKLFFGQQFVPKYNDFWMISMISDIGSSFVEFIEKKNLFCLKLHCLMTSIFLDLPKEFMEF